MKVIDGIKSHFVPFTEDEEKKTLFINNKTITVYRSDLPNPSSCPDLSNETISSSSLFDVNLSQGSHNQTSADEGSESPDSFVSSLSSRTDRQRTAFF